MDPRLYFESHQECVRYAQWLRNVLPKPNPLENDAEFYAVVTFIINITFKSNSLRPRTDATIDTFLHTGVLLNFYFAKHPRLDPQTFAHTFAHFFVLSIYLHSDHTLALSQYQGYFKRPFPIKLSDKDLLAHLAAVNYNPCLLSTDFTQLRQDLAETAAPTHLPLPLLTVVAPIPIQHTCLANEVPEFLSRCDTALQRYILWGIGVLVVGAVAAIAVGALLHLMLPLLVGVVALTIGISGSVGILTKKLCSDSQRFFSSKEFDPEMDSLSFSLAQTTFLR